MIEVGGKPVLEHLVEHLNSFGIHEIIVNLHHKPNVIMEYFGTRLMYSYEPELLGEVKTILGLKKWLGDKFVVMNGDTLTDVDLDIMIEDIGTVRLASIYTDKDEETYAGTCMMREAAFKELYKVKNFNEFSESLKGLRHTQPHSTWIDMGTPEGLKKARQHYEEKTKK